VAPLWAILGLSPIEILILMLCGLMPLAAAAVAIVIVLRVTRKKRDPEEE
jgi:hypothetical protein